MIYILSLICLFTGTVHCMNKIQGKPLKPCDQKALLYASFSQAVKQDKAFEIQLNKHPEPTVVYYLLKNPDLEATMKYALVYHGRRKSVARQEMQSFFTSLEDIQKEDSQKNCTAILRDEPFATPTYEEAIFSEVEV